MADGPSSNEPRLVRPYISRHDRTVRSHPARRRDHRDGGSGPDWSDIADADAPGSDHWGDAPHWRDDREADGDEDGDGTRRARRAEVVATAVWSRERPPDEVIDDDWLGQAGEGPGSHRRQRSWLRRRPAIVAAVGIVLAAVAGAVIAGQAADRADPGWSAGSGDSSGPAATEPRASVPPSSAGPSATGSPSPPATAAPSTTPPRPPAPAATGAVVGAGGMCLTATVSNRGNGNPVYLSTCTGIEGQLWTAASDGTLSVAGRCMRAGPDPAPGTPVETWRCDGGGSQQWRFTSANLLVNLASGLCLESPDASPPDGSDLRVAECDGTAEQLWSLRRT